jgi:mannitol 2-dehydrogenase
MEPTSRPAAAVVQPLDNAILDDPPAAVDVPAYDRTALSPGVVHIGVGAFHRAHQEVYFHDLAQRGVMDWGVIGVGLRSRDLKDALEPQDLLYTVVERGPEHDSARVVGTLHRYLHAPDDPQAVIDALADPRVRLVTLTVTPQGYHLDPATDELDAEAEDVVHDLEHPEAPATFMGHLVAALDRRRRAGSGPFTVLSCDNIIANGSMTRRVVLAFARLRDAGLADWIAAHVTFPNSMVDRITPETTDEDVRQVEEVFGIGDRRPAVTEAFRQWIVEDAFCNGRPPLDQVGVQLVADVRPYERMKKRLLNGSHVALAYLGLLAGHRTMDEVLADPDFRDYIERLLEDELVPSVGEVPGIDLAEYEQTLVGRLANPRMKDELTRLGRRGSTKVPSYLVAAMVDARSAGRPHPLLTVAVAGWLRCLRRCGLDGEPLELDDDRAEELDALAGHDPRPLLDDASLFLDLAGDAALARDLEAALRAIDQDGPRAAIRAALAGAAAAPLAEAA